MANFRIDQLQPLASNSLDASSDFLIVQKPNAGTFKMSANNLVNNSAQIGIAFLESAQTINSNQGGFLNYDVTNAGVPSSANSVFLSIQHRGSAHPDMNFSFYTANHNGSENASAKHNFIFNASDKSQWTHNSLWVPVINQNIYYHISSDNTWHVYLHAYM